MNYDGYNIDDSERRLKEYEVEVAELKKRHKVLSNPPASCDKIRNLRKRKNATSTQQVIICLLTIKKFKYLVL